MAHQDRWQTTWKPALGLVGWWALLCTFAHHRGVGVYAPLGRTWQLLEPAWLQTDPLGSLWRLHAQPPLYNAVIAAVLALDPTATGAVVHGLLEGLGAVAGLLTWQLALRLGAGPVLAWLAGAVLMTSPGFWLISHWLFYDLPVTVALTGLLVLTPAAVQGRWGAQAGVMAAAVALGWSRSLFHPLWAVGVFALLTVAESPDRRRRSGALAALAVALMALPYAKNWQQFGTPNASSWAGMSLLRTAHAYSSPHTRRELAKAGLLSPAGVVGPFRDLQAYGSAWPTRDCRDPHPALCAARKPTGGPNFNHVAYIGLSRQMVGDAVAIYAAEPSAWLRAQVGSWLAWLRPVGVYPFLRPVRQPIEDVHRAWAQTMLIEVDGAAVVVAFGVFVALAILAVRLWRVGRQVPRGTQFALLSVAAWTVLWVALVGNTLEHGENYRFRAYLDPLFLALCAAAGSAAWGQQRSNP